jgi:RNA polymerase sigma factor (sigma-70 family)
MSFAAWFGVSNPCQQFADHLELFEALQRLDTSAILCLQDKAAPSLRLLVKQYRLPTEEYEDLMSRATFTFLKKIEDGAYQFQGNAPSTYFIEIAKNLALSATRGKRHAYEPLDDHHELHDEGIEADQRQKESREMVRELLGRMGPPCNEVIRLHHIDGYTDEEVIRMGLTKYATTASLKVKRSECMKKLIQLANEWKITNHT